MRPLNEYPKEELEELETNLVFADIYGSTPVLSEWIRRVREAISDQEFEEKQLPFNEPSK